MVVVEKEGQRGDGEWQYRCLWAGECWESRHVMVGEEGGQTDCGLVMASGNTGAGGCWEGNRVMRRKGGGQTGDGR